MRPTRIGGLTIVMMIVAVLALVAVQVVILSQPKEAGPRVTIRATTPHTAGPEVKPIAHLQQSPTVAASRFPPSEEQELKVADELGASARTAKLSSVAGECAEFILSSWQEYGRANRYRLQQALDRILQEEAGPEWLQAVVAEAEPGLLYKLSEIIAWPCDDEDCRTAEKLELDTLPAWIRESFLHVLGEEAGSKRAGAAFRLFLFQRVDDPIERATLLGAAFATIQRDQPAEQDALANAAYAIVWNESEPASIPEATMRTLMVIARDDGHPDSDRVFTVLMNAHPDVSAPLLLEVMGGPDAEKKRRALGGLSNAYNHIGEVWQALPSVEVERSLAANIEQTLLSDGQLMADTFVRSSLLLVCARMGDATAAGNILASWAASTNDDAVRSYLSELAALRASGAEPERVQAWLREVPWR